MTKKEQDREEEGKEEKDIQRGDTEESTEEGDIDKESRGRRRRRG